MKENGLFNFHLLDEAPYGAYAVDMNQTILFWNRSAERILGHATEQVIGLKCYQVLQGIPENGTAPVCIEGCPAILDARAGRLPPVAHVMARRASGERKPITITRLIFSGDHSDQTVLLHLFHEWMDAPARQIASAVEGTLLAGMSTGEPRDSASDPAVGKASPLTARELEVLRLVAQGMETGEIVDELNLSHHTVRNYIRNAREKLQAKSKTAAVLTAQRLGLF